MVKDMRTLILAGMALAVVPVWAEPRTGNCRSRAEVVTPQAADRTGSLLREWSEAYGEWYDGGEDDAPTQDQFASYWMKVTLTRGLDYVISADVSTGNTLLIESAETDQSYTSVFGGNSVQVGNRIYRYVRAKDWESFSAVNYYVHMVGYYGAVGRPYAVAVQQKSITDIIPAAPGSDDSPIALDVSADGLRVIDEPPVGKRTVYSATFKANETYVFTGIAPSLGKEVLVTLSEEEYKRLTELPGTAVVDQRTHTLTVSVTRDHTAKLWVMADDEGLSWSVAGGTLSWKVGVPGRGTLKDRDTATQRATFDIIARTSGDRKTFSGTLTVNGVAYSYRDNGNGEMVGETIVGGQVYPSYFTASLTADGNFEIDGSMTLDVGGPKEFFFSGTLGNGAYIIRYDPGAGVGAMPDRACEWGRVYKLDDCTFKAPGGTRFAGWLHDGRRYDPKMLIFNQAGEADKPQVFTAIWVPVE